MAKIKDRIITGFFTTLLIAGVIVMAMPFLPEVYYRIFPAHTIPVPIYQPIKADTIAESDETPGEDLYLTDGNRIVIPAIGVDTKILEGANEDVMLLEEGAWRDPETSTPGQKGNIVIGGHRFQYLPPNTTTFYNLDKLAQGDEIIIYWESKMFKYKIFNIFEVNPDGVWIKNQDPTFEELTVYTCTPVYTSLRRLVIKAERVI
jgi:LPXTG-site transpeptidase (sortase) family protein